MSREVESVVMDDQIRRKIVENRKRMGYKQGDVVTQMQLVGMDISYQMYKNVECGRRRLTVSEFLFLIVFLNIDVSSMSRKIFVY